MLSSRLFILAIFLPALAFCMSPPCRSDSDCDDHETCVRGVCVVKRMCPANMHHVTCGSSCQEECFKPKPTICNKRCFNGCVCDEGYVLQAPNQCVQRNQCRRTPTPRPPPPPPTSDPTCPANMHFVTCGSVCHPTCDQPGPVPCTKQCFRGCVCDDGYLLDADNKCIKKEECPQACPSNMHHDDCASTCQEKCNEPLPEICNLACFNGCVCDEGYVLNEEGHCVRHEECPAPAAAAGRCQENMHMSNCKSSCPETCGQPKRTCINKMCTRGCVCNDGYILDTKGKKCIRRETCRNAETTTQPQNRCLTVKCSAGYECVDGKCVLDRCAIVRCQGGYECVEGKCVFRRDCPMIKMAEPPEHCTYVRELNERGCLVPKLHCTEPVVEKKEIKSECGPNAHMSDCTNICPPIHCGNLGQKLVCFSLRCGAPGCVCDDGYMFKSADKSLGCVKREECLRKSAELNRPAEKVCGPNEHYTNCGTACEPTCGKPEPRMCTMQCIVDVCQCNPGFYRHPTKGCVAKYDC